MKLVYVAGPFRAENAYQVALNIRAAEWQGYKVARMGAVPVIPHTMYRFFDGTLNDQYWLRATKDLLLRCDAIFLIDGWEESVGSRGERAAAEQVGIPIFEDDKRLKEWIDGKKA